MTHYSKNDLEYRNNGHYQINDIDYMSIWTFKNKHNIQSLLNPIRHHLLFLYGERFNCHKRRTCTQSKEY